MQTLGERVMHNYLNSSDFTTEIIYRSPSLNNKLYIITSGPKVKNNLELQPYLSVITPC